MNTEHPRETAIKRKGSKIVNSPPKMGRNFTFCGEPQLQRVSSNPIHSPPKPPINLNTRLETQPLSPRSATPAKETRHSSPRSKKTRYSGDHRAAQLHIEEILGQENANLKAQNALLLEEVARLRGINRAQK